MKKNNNHTTVVLMYNPKVIGFVRLEEERHKLIQKGEVKQQIITEDKGHEKEKKQESNWKKRVIIQLWSYCIIQK